jgi:hypothetical protein
MFLEEGATLRRVWNIFSENIFACGLKAEVSPKMRSKPSKNHENMARKWSVSNFSETLVHTPIKTGG